MKEYNNIPYLDVLKWIAILSMVIDHIGFIFFPEMTLFRMIGRMALPIFMVLLAEGAVRTSNQKRHFNRLLFFSIVSQLPYSLLFHTWSLNVLFTMVLAVIGMRLPFFIPIGFILTLLIPMDYGWYGYLLALTYFYLHHKRFFAIQIGTVLTIIFTHSIGVGYQAIAIIGLVLPELIKHLQVNVRRTPKDFFYWFYPVHMLLLFMIVTFIINRF